MTQKTAIAANELRIGNAFALEDNSFAHFGVVYSISPTVVQLRGNGVYFSVHPSELHPIELTPEILEKVGFVKGLADSSFEYKKVSIHLPGKLWHNGRTYFNSWCIIEGYPEHLHLAQNLIHALTAEELPLTL